MATTTKKSARKKRKTAKQPQTYLFAKGMRYADLDGMSVDEQKTVLAGASAGMV